MQSSCKQNDLPPDSVLGVLGVCRQVSVAVFAGRTRAFPWRTRSPRLPTPTLRHGAVAMPSPPVFVLHQNGPQLGIHSIRNGSLVSVVW